MCARGCRSSPSSRTTSGPRCSRGCARRRIDRSRAARQPAVAGDRSAHGRSTPRAPARLRREGGARRRRSAPAGAIRMPRSKPALRTLRRRRRSTTRCCTGSMHFVAETRAVRLVELARGQAAAAGRARAFPTSTRGPNCGRPRSSTPTIGARSTSRLRRAAARRPRRGWPLPPVDETGAAKLLVTSRALRLRRDRPELFTRYTPMTVVGEASDHAIAFDRGGVVAVATRLPLGLAAARRLGRDGAAAPRRSHRRRAHRPAVRGHRARARATCCRVYPVALLGRRRRIA